MAAAGQDPPGRLQVPFDARAGLLAGCCPPNGPWPNSRERREEGTDKVGSGLGPDREGGGRSWECAAAA